MTRSPFEFTPGPPDFRVDWAAIEGAFAWVRAMGGVPQDPRWHAEGDVLVHTRQVAEAMAADPAWRSLAAAERHELFAAALLHDVAKGATLTIDETGIHAPKHAAVGRQMARRLFWDGFREGAHDVAARERVLGLVRFHGLPLRFLDKPSPERAVVMASLQVDLRRLAILARADVLGRECADRAALLDAVAMFEDFAAEHGCLGGAAAFESDHHRFSYCVRRTERAYVPFDDARCEAVLMSGLPGAGKDHWIARHAGGAAVIGLDRLREGLGVDPAGGQASVVAAAKARARELLRAGRPFVWNATNVTAAMRRQLIALFTGYRARVGVVYVECPWETLAARNGGRREPVPAGVIDRLADKLDVPTAAECHGVRIVPGP